MTSTETKIVLFSITLCWASSYIFIKNLPPTLSPFAYMTLTSGLAGIIFIIVFFNKLRELKGKLLMHSGIMAAVICGSLFFERLGIANIPASTASFVASLNIVFVPLLLLLLKRKPTKNNLLGIVLILLGLILTSEVHPGHSLDSGVLYMVASCIFMSVYIIITDNFTKKYDPLLLGIGQMFITAIIAYVIWFLEDPRTSIEDLSQTSPIDFSKGRIQQVLLACSLLKERGERVALEICGPYTILSCLMDISLLFKAWRKNPQSVENLFAFINENLLQYFKAACEARVDIISYADPAGNLKILGPKYTEKTAYLFTVPFLQKARDITAGKALIHLCPQTTFILTGLDLAEFVNIAIPELTSYAEAALAVIGKADIIGQACLQENSLDLNTRNIKAIRLKYCACSISTTSRSRN